MRVYRERYKPVNRSWGSKVFRNPLVAAEVIGRFEWKNLIGFAILLNG